MVESGVDWTVLACSTAVFVVLCAAMTATEAVAIVAVVLSAGLKPKKEW